MIDIWYCPYCMSPGWLDEVLRDAHAVREHPGKPVIWDNGASLEQLASTVNSESPDWKK